MMVSRKLVTPRAFGVEYTRRSWRIPHVICLDRLDHVVLVRIQTSDQIRCTCRDRVVRENSPLSCVVTRAPFSMPQFGLFHPMLDFRDVSKGEVRQYATATAPIFYPQAPLSDDHYIEVSSFKHFELPDALPGGRPCRWLVPHEAKGSQVLRPFYFAASTNSDQTEIEAENGGHPVPLCLGNCGNPPCRVRLKVADDVLCALQDRGLRIEDWCCGSCVLSHLTFANVPEVQHRVKSPN